jgi:hypothetical protein
VKAPPTWPTADLVEEFRQASHRYGDALLKMDEAYRQLFAPDDMCLLNGAPRPTYEDLGVLATLVALIDLDVNDAGDNSQRLAQLREILDDAPFAQPEPGEEP